MGLLRSLFGIGKPKKTAQSDPNRSTATSDSSSRSFSQPTPAQVWKERVVSAESSSFAAKERTCKYTITQRNILDSYATETRRVNSYKVREVIHRISAQKKQFESQRTDESTGHSKFSSGKSTIGQQHWSDDAEDLVSCIKLFTLGTLMHLPNETITRISLYLPFRDVVHSVMMVSLGMRQHVLSEDAALPYFHAITMASWGRRVEHFPPAPSSAGLATTAAQEANDGEECAEFGPTLSAKELTRLGPNSLLGSLPMFRFIELWAAEVGQLRTCVPALKLPEKFYPNSYVVAEMCVAGPNDPEEVLLSSSYHLFKSLYSSPAEVSYRCDESIQLVQREIDEVDKTTTQLVAARKKKFQEWRRTCFVQGAALGFILAWLGHITGVEGRITGTLITVVNQILSLISGMVCDSAPQYRQEVFEDWGVLAWLGDAAMTAFFVPLLLLVLHTHRKRYPHLLPRPPNFRMETRHIVTIFGCGIIFISQLICPTFISRFQSGFVLLDVIFGAILFPWFLSKLLVLSPLFSVIFGIASLYLKLSHLIAHGFTVLIGIVMIFVFHDAESRQRDVNRDVQGIQTQGRTKKKPLENKLSALRAKHERVQRAAEEIERDKNKDQNVGNCVIS